jgi:hypothetical protein
MRYYVPVGPGGPFFRVGMVVTGLMGSLVYWRASRRREAASAVKLATPVGDRGSIMRRTAMLTAYGPGSNTG